LQLITKLFGGSVNQIKTYREFGRSTLLKRNNSLLTKNFFINRKAIVWMSHQDSVTKIPKNFKKIAYTKDSVSTIIANEKRNIYGIQFHPEVTHTERGKIILKNFLFSICKIKKNWKLSNEKNKLIAKIREQVGSNKKVLCALSGGVDSTVVALLLNKAIKKNLKCIMVNTGLMRKNEFEYSSNILRKKYKLNIKIINSNKLFLKRLKNVSDPEKKRKIIGALFIKIFEKEAKKIKNVKFLAQGTLYTDLIESKSATGSKTSKIKSHHNVGGLPKKMNLVLVEPT
jgi:GMP synthase, PP-ATPase domain/subunit